METKKYTTHSSFWWSIALFISWAALMALQIIWQPSQTLLKVLLYSFILVYYLVMAIRCGLAWHAYVEISEEGVKMMGCAKRISSNKKETVDDLFIPWENIEKINVWDDTLLILYTGEKIKLTQQIDIKGKALRKAFEQYKPKTKPKTEQTQEPFEVVGVIGLASDNTSLNEFTATE